MKRIVTKLTSRRGETLVEILVAVLIIALASGMFASLYSASMNINLTARREDEAFYKAVGDLENMIDSDDETPTDGNKRDLHYVPSKGAEQDIPVDVVTQDGMSVYKDNGTSGSGTSDSGGGGE